MYFYYYYYFYGISLFLSFISFYLNRTQFVTYSRRFWNIYSSTHRRKHKITATASRVTVSVQSALLFSVDRFSFSINDRRNANATKLVRAVNSFRLRVLRSVVSFAESTCPCRATFRSLRVEDRVSAGDRRRRFRSSGFRRRIEENRRCCSPERHIRRTTPAVSVFIQNRRGRVEKPIDPPL